MTEIQDEFVNNFLKQTPLTNNLLLKIKWTISRALEGRNQRQQSEQT